MSDTGGDRAAKCGEAGVAANRTVFLDNWVIERLLDEVRIRELLLPTGGSALRSVMSLWHLYEIANDGDDERARRKAALLDELDPLWINTLVHIREEILKEHLWVYLRMKPAVAPVNPFSNNLTEATEVAAGSPSPIPLTASKHVDFLKKHPELLDEPRVGVQKWAKATLLVMSNKDEAIRRIDAVMRGLLQRQLPTRTPAGLEIPATDLDSFIAQFEWKKVPLLALEAALYESELAWHARLDEGDAVDIQYLSVALLYCDVAVVDKRMAELTRRASAGLLFKLAKVLKDPVDLLTL
jgi:hypothetical protein